MGKYYRSPCYYRRNLDKPAMTSNKKIKFASFAGWDANTQGGFAIMPYAPAPLI
jgi:hypothetical protein